MVQSSRLNHFLIFGMKFYQLFQNLFFQIEKRGGLVVPGLVKIDVNRCVTQQRYVPGDDLEDALQFLSTKDLSASAEICSECLYKFILTLADTFSDMLSRKEKTDEIKRYVDKFSLMIAIKHSQMDGTARRCIQWLNESPCNGERNNEYHQHPECRRNNPPVSPKFGFVQHDE